MHLFFGGGRGGERASLPRRTSKPHGWIISYRNGYNDQDVSGCSSLRSSEQGLLFVPFARTSTTQARAFSVVGPSVWNGLPLSQRLLPRILSDTFYSSLKTLLFSRARVGSASE